LNTRADRFVSRFGDVGGITHPHVMGDLDGSPEAPAHRRFVASTAQRLPHEARHQETTMNTTTRASHPALRALAYNHNETVLRAMAYNHNETVLAAGARPVAALAVAAALSALLGVSSSPGAIAGVDGVGGSPGALTVQAASYDQEMDHG